MSPAEQAIQEAIDSPLTSYWLKDALREALKRDPVDMAIESRQLARLLGDRMYETLQEVEA